MYVIFTGERKSKPEYLSLSKEFFGGEESTIEVKVKMVYDGKEGDKNVLKEYLENREQEVVNIMMTLFDNEYILKTYVNSEKLDYAREAAIKFYKKGNSVEDIADALDVSVEEVKEWVGLVTV